jgi:hypothetical protein
VSKESKLKGVAHNTMDHAVSGLGFLTPHVVDYFIASGERRLRLNLLAPEPATIDNTLPTPLRAAAESCQGKFVHILTHAGFQLSDVLSARLEFMGLPEGEPRDFSCECILESAAGKRIVAAMNSQTYWSGPSLRPRKDPFDAIRKLRHGG